MMLFPNTRKGAKLRSWRGRHKKCTVHINEVFNDDLQTVDRYTYKIVSIQHNIRYLSESDNLMLHTVGEAMHSATEYIDAHIRPVVDEIINERPVYLTSLNPHNYRHGQEKPKVIGMVSYTPKGLDERLCFKVRYESDGKTDYIAYSSFTDGDWAISGGEPV